MRPKHSLHTQLHKKNKLMATTISVTSITAVPPIDIYVGDAYGSFVYYSSSTSTGNFIINVPPPYDTLSLLGVKIVDAQGSVGIQSEIPPSQTPTPSITSSPTMTPTNTASPTVTPSNTATPTPTNPTQRFDVLRFDGTNTNNGYLFGNGPIATPFSNEIYILYPGDPSSSNIYGNNEQTPPRTNSTIITKVENNQFYIRVIEDGEEQYGSEITSGLNIHELKNYNGSSIGVYGITASGVSSNSGQWVWSSTTAPLTIGSYYQLDQASNINNPYNTLYSATTNIWFTASTNYQPKTIQQCNNPAETKIIYGKDLSSYNNGDVVTIDSVGPQCYVFDDTITTSVTAVVDISNGTITNKTDCFDPSCP